MRIGKYIIGAAAASTMLALSAVSASAAYACSGNVCWVVKERYEYPADARIVVQPDTYRPGPEITIREHGPGRGYYVGGEWRTW